MKRIDRHSNLWAHIICVNWNPEIYFTDEYRNKVSGVLNEKRFDLFCNYCRKSGKGACIQCDFHNCPLSYHVRCAVRRGMIKEWSEFETIINPLAGDWHYLPLYCERHERAGYS
jgi:hypothetical protein